MLANAARRFGKAQKRATTSVKLREKRSEKDEEVGTNDPPSRDRGESYCAANSVMHCAADE